MAKNHIFNIPGSSVLHSIKSRIFYGWWIVILGSLIQGVEGGILYNCFTVFFLPLKRDFGVDSATISFLYGAARLEGGLEGPIAGHLIDKFGPRATIIGGGIMAGVGLILLSAVHNFWTFFFIFIFIVSLGYNAGCFHPITTAVNNWFIRYRGMGFSCISASMSVGGMILAPFLAHIILNYGWRIGALTAGILILIVSIPAAIPIYRSPEVLGLYPDGRSYNDISYQKSGLMQSQSIDSDFTVREALQTKTYWMLTMGISLRLFVTIALNAHFIPILVWKGISEETAAYFVSLFAFGSIIATLGMGWMGDRWPKSLLCSLGIIPTIMAMLGLAFSQTPLFIYLLPVSLALTMGIAPLNWALIGDFFGRQSYARLRGIMAVIYGTGTFLSPVYAGWVFDITENYTIVLITFSIILLITASIFAFLYRTTLGNLKQKSLNA